MTWRLPNAFLPFVSQGRNLPPQCRSLIPRPYYPRFLRHSMTVLHFTPSILHPLHTFRYVPRAPCRRPPHVLPQRLFPCVHLRSLFYLTLYSRPHVGIQDAIQFSFQIGEKMIEVRITDPDCKQRPGAEVLRLSTDEYFRRFHDQETRKNLALKAQIESTKSQVERLQNEMVVQCNLSKLSKLENNRTVAEVTKFWRNTIMMGESRIKKQQLDFISK